MEHFYELIGKRKLNCFSSLVNELNFDNTKNYLFELSHLGILKIEGEKAQEFLQGQLTCNLLDVDFKNMRQGAQCNLKGRVLTLIDIVKTKENELNLIIPLDLIPETENSLAKTAMLSRVKINKVSKYKLFGFYSNNQEDIMPFDLQLSNSPYSVISSESYYCYCLTHNLYIFIVEENVVNKLTENFINKSQYRGSYAWHYLNLKQDKIDIYPESRGLFLPHNLNLQSTGYISFNKGCYKGQEIIARMHYRSKLKYELKLFEFKSEETIYIGQKLINIEDNQIIGEIVDFCPLMDNKFLIAVSVLFNIPLIVNLEGNKLPVELEIL